jgi:hypothetical protein
MIGRTLGQYQILAKLGEGGMGEVYRARDATLNRDVAIKVLLPAVADDPDRLARFKREAQVLASLNHPNIAHVHGFEDAPPDPSSSAGPARVRALVMELVDGPTLADRIARGPIVLDDALPLEKARETLMPLTLTSSNEQQPVWTGDGKRLVFASREGSVSDLYARAADATGTVERLTSGAQDPLPAFVSPDGTGILGTLVSPRGSGDIVWLPSRTARTPPSDPSPAKPVVSTPFSEYYPDVSPNRRYMAYQSNESDRFEIYVETLSRSGGGKWRVSTQGGNVPVWARNGRELFYVDGANILMAVPVDISTEAFTFGTPARLFEMKVPQTSVPRDYDVSADGRFLTLTPGDRVTGSASPRMVVVLNWLEELKAKLPVESAPRRQ